MSSKDKVSTWRAKLSEDKKQQMRDADRERRAKKRAAMTEEEKEAAREKDRARKAAKRSESAKNSDVDWRTLPRPKPADYQYKAVYNERESNKQYKRRVRQSRSAEEGEFEKIQNLLIKRTSRAKRTAERKDEENDKARKGMKLLGDEGALRKFKVRRAKGESEEYLWWKYWNKGESNKEILFKKLPLVAAKFQEWVKAGKSPYDGVIDTDPDPNMTEEERFVFNRHGHLTKIKAIRKKNEEILKINDI